MDVKSGCQQVKNRCIAILFEKYVLLLQRIYCGECMIFLYLSCILISMEVETTRHKVAIYLFDIRNRNVGLGEFEWQLGSELARRAGTLRRQHGIELTFIVPKKYVGQFGDEVRYIALTPLLRCMVRYSSERFDICHLTQQMSKLKFMRNAGVNLMTVHDINFMYEKSGHKLERRKRKFAKALKRADVLTYISQFVKSDVEAHFSPRMEGSVIYNGVTDLNDVHGDISRFGIADGYLFHISSLLPKKNVHKLVEMMRYLPDERLVVVGNLSTEYISGIKAKIAEWRLTNVIMLENVSNEEKAELYRHCKAFLFPSLCEGFGLPPLEAMYFGKPVFLSSLTSLPEVGGANAYFFDNLNEENMALTVREGLADFYTRPEEAAEAVRRHAASFTWSQCAESYIQLYLKLLKR